VVHGDDSMPQFHAGDAETLWPLDRTLYFLAAVALSAAQMFPSAATRLIVPALTRALGDPKKSRYRASRSLRAARFSFVRAIRQSQALGAVLPAPMAEANRGEVAVKSD
jgi:hypothetical protein